MNAQQNSEQEIRPERDLVHDLRSPLTGIMGFAELLLEDDSIEGKNREYLEIILRESYNMERLMAEFSGERTN